MQPGAVLLLHLLYGKNFSAQASELGKLLLDSLQPFIPLAVSDMSTWLISALTAILLVQLLNLSNLHSETPDLFPQNFEVIHGIKDSLFGLTERKDRRHRASDLSSTASILSV
jgi:hypothetical protein